MKRALQTNVDEIYFVTIFTKNKQT